MYRSLVLLIALVGCKSDPVDTDTDTDTDTDVDTDTDADTTPDNLVPICTSVEPVTIVEGQTADVRFTCTDPEGQPLESTVTTTIAGLTASDNGPQSPLDVELSFAPGSTDAGETGQLTTSVQVDVSDALGGTTAAMVEVTYNNPPPVWSPQDDVVVTAGTELSVELSASNPDADVQQFAAVLPSYVTSTQDGDSTTLLIAPEAADDDGVPFVIQLEVDDQQQGVDTLQFTVTVNQAPVADAGLDQQVGQDSVVTLDAAGSMDPDGDDLVYSWQPVDSAPALSDASAEQPTFTASACDVTHTYVLTVDDGYVTHEDSVDVQVDCNYAVGGTVQNLMGQGLTLVLNEDVVLEVTDNGDFAFPPVVDGSSYAVTVGDSPTSLSQTCSVSNGTGTIAGGPVQDIVVDCVTDSFTVGVSVHNLVGTSRMVQNNGADPIEVTADGDYTFAVAITDGETYDVTVSEQQWNQNCVVVNGSGTVDGANVTEPALYCVSTPTNLRTTPSAIGNVNDIVVMGTADSGDTVNLYSDELCTVSLGASGSAATFAAPGIAVTVESDMVHRIYAQATGPFAVDSPCSLGVVYEEDSTINDPVIEPVPATGEETYVALAGTGDANDTLHLFTDDACSSPYRNVSIDRNGDFLVDVPAPLNETIQVSVYATDAAGNQSNCVGPVTYAQNTIPRFETLPQVVTCQPGEPVTFAATASDTQVLTYSEGTSTCDMGQRVGPDGTVTFTCGSHAATSCDIEVLADDGEVSVEGALVVRSRDTVYVTVSGAGNRSGTSWSNAMSSIPAALSAASSLGDADVWVARGVYQGTGDVYLQIPENVGLFGSFVGNEAALADRPTFGTVPTTVLNGDVNGDGSGPGDVHHLVEMAADTVLDGFTLTGASADGFRGGESIGAAVYSDQEQRVTLRNLEVSDNQSDAIGWGGAIHLDAQSTGSVLIEDVFMTRNRSTSNLGYGGAIGVDGVLTLRRGIFANNSANRAGGALHVRAGQATVSDSVFLGNDSSDGGGIDTDRNAGLRLDRVIFAYNTGRDGGGLHAEGRLRAYDTVLLGNDATTGGGATLNDDAVFIRSLIAKNSGSFGGGVSVGPFNGSGRFVDTAWIDNDGAIGGAINSTNSDLRLYNNTFRGGNSSRYISAGFGNHALHNTLFGTQPNLYFAIAATDLSHGCAPSGAQGPGSVNWSSNPFDTTPASLTPFLSPGNHCEDQGDDALASIGNPEWSSYSTRADGGLDTGTVDIGAHFAPDAVQINTFVVGGTNVSWTTQNADWCEIYDPRGNQVAVANVASGSSAHGMASGTRLIIFCFGPSTPAAASAVVPAP